MVLVTKRIRDLYPKTSRMSYCAPLGASMRFVSQFSSEGAKRQPHKQAASFQNLNKAKARAPRSCKIFIKNPAQKSNGSHRRFRSRTFKLGTASGVRAGFISRVLKNETTSTLTFDTQ